MDSALKWAVLFALLVSSPRNAIADDSLSLRLDPHYYGGARGNEPSGQLVALAGLDWGTSAPETSLAYLKLHLETETQGRRDTILDLDRAWFAVPTSSASGGARLFFGRLHPWELLHHPAGTEPWGLLGQRQPQNRGLLLGYGMRWDSPTPNPELLGWIGLHWWSGNGPVQLTVSFSPLFIPGIGPETSYSPAKPASTGRFGRRPPSEIQIAGKTYPIHYSIDRSRIWQDVVLQPQWMAQLRLNESKRVESWVTLSRSPSPVGTPESKGFLNVADLGIHTVAEVRPLFRERWDLTWVQAFKISDHTALTGTLFGSSDRSWGAELGASTQYGSVSLLNETPLKAEAGRYSDWMAQIDGSLPLASFTFHSGLKIHLSSQDLWLRTGVSFLMNPKVRWDLGADIFGGDEGTYFGEWRTNDRVSLAVQWQVGT